MKSLKLLFFITGLSFGLFDGISAIAQTTNLDALIQAAEGTTPLPPGFVPFIATFYSAQNPANPPAPANVLRLPAWNLGNGLWLLDDFDVDYATITPFGMMPPLPSSNVNEATNSGVELGGSGFSWTLDTNGLWLQIASVDTALVSLNLNNATNEVYAIWSTTDPSSGDWQVETEVWPTNSVVTSSSVSSFGRPNLFMRAEDWTGVTENGNTVPDWWFFYYFGKGAFPGGHLALSDSSLDAQGANTLLYDYQNELDPNIIRFSYSITNNYVATSIATVQLSVSGGSAGYVGMALDDTNYISDAVWHSFDTPNQTVYLGTNAGWHVLWVGMKGPAPDATASWERVRFNLQPVPPAFVVTNPTVSTVAARAIQVQGYSSSPLSSITYDVSNAMGMVTNLQGAFVNHYYDIKAFAYTTNYFQLFDVALTSGSNFLRIHARDLAGNIATSNFTFVVNYAAHTNPPVFTLYWPQNDEQIGGSTATIRGWIDNPSAQINATIVDALGGTNRITGIVERNGLVWLEDVPLAAGTNVVFITAVDLGGNVSTTNFNVVGSDLQVTIDPVDTISLYQSTLDVSGAISDPNDYTVWVNGVMASQDGSGNWYAAGVPLNRNSGRALVQARAIPNSDNGGSGTGGGGPLNNTNQGNPVSPREVTTQLSPDRPIEMTVTTYDAVESTPFEMHPKEGWTVTQVYIYDAPENNASLNTVIYIPPSNYTTNTLSWSDIMVALAPGQEHADYNNPIPQLISYPGKPLVEGTWPWQRNSDTMFSLITGGVGVPGHQSIYGVQVGASIITDIYWPLEGLSSPPYYSAAPGEIEADGQTPDTNYTVYLLAPDNTTNDFPINVPGQQYVTFGADATKYTLTLSTGGDINSTQTIHIGDQVTLSGMPASTVWTISGQGTLSATTGGATTFTAAQTPSSATITGTVGSVKQTVSFTIVKPTQ